MPLNQSGGEMYPNTCTINHLGGDCPHNCSYCYRKAIKRRYRALEKKYSGSINLIEKELRSDLYKFGQGVTVFVVSMNDLFAQEVPDEWIERVLAHCRTYPGNKYHFQTKNPGRLKDFVLLYPPRTALGTTIESDLGSSYSRAPTVFQRVEGMKALRERIRTTGRTAGIETMVSAEPLARFTSPEVMADLLLSCEPDFISIGVDSKSLDPGFSWPDVVDTVNLIFALNEMVELRIKSNMKRFLGEQRYNLLGGGICDGKTADGSASEVKLQK